MNFFTVSGCCIDIGLARPDRAAGALDVVAGAHQDFHARRSIARGACGTEISAASMSPLTSAAIRSRLALERDHLVVLADLHLEGARHHGRALVVVGGAGAAVAERLALEVLRLVDVRARRDQPLRLERLADDVADLGAAQRRLRAAGRDRHEIDAAGEARGHQRPPGAM